MQAKAGSYALILSSTTRTHTRAGCWGHLEFQPGYYMYVGSAFGPGGVNARVLRHSRTGKARHWHIDYLRENVEFAFAWYDYEPENLEHRWATALSNMVGFTAIKGFGCSDCRCYSHLFFSRNEPDISLFSHAVGGSVAAWCPNMSTRR